MLKRKSQLRLAHTHTLAHRWIHQHLEEERWGLKAAKTRSEKNKLVSSEWLEKKEGRLAEEEDALMAVESRNASIEKFRIFFGAFWLCAFFGAGNVINTHNSWYTQRRWLPWYTNCDTDTVMSTALHASMPFLWRTSSKAAANSCGPARVYSEPPSQSDCLFELMQFGFSLSRLSKGSEGMHTAPRAIAAARKKNQCGKMCAISDTWIAFNQFAIQ